VTVAEDCGVSGGCPACPLFAGNVCGDPAPEELPGMWEAADLIGGQTDEQPDAPDVDPNEPRPEGVGCCGGACFA